MIDPRFPARLGHGFTLELRYSSVASNGGRGATVDDHMVLQAIQHHIPISTR